MGFEKLNSVCRPVYYRGQNRSEAEKLLRKKSPPYFAEAFSRQLKELFFVENPQFAGPRKTKIYQSDIFKKYLKQKENQYLYIFYPWLQTLVKSVGQADYFQLKTNRNQALITAKEQLKLRDLKVGIFGMSVGSNIAFVLTQAGISNRLTIADFDELDTTNLNRIWAGVHQVGLNKAVVAARRIYEDNPFARVRVLTKGITVPRLSRLLVKKEIGLIVEEIDNMPMKIEVRKLALKHRVPVLMVTDNGDSVHLTIERYDLGYGEIFGKPLGYWSSRIAECSGAKGFADIVINDILGGAQNVDPRMMDSVGLILKKELVSWPQLGSAALLGGVAATVAIKKIVNGEDKKKLSRYPVTALK